MVGLAAFVFIGTVLVLEVLLLLALGYSVGSYANYWKKHNNTLGNEVNYIALGDSTAQGIGASRANKSYVGLLAEEQDLKVANLSISGAKIKDVIDDQLPKLANYDTSTNTTITLAIGANDMQDFEPEKFERQFDELLKQLPKQTVVADIPYFGGGRFRKLESSVETANVIARRLVKKHNLKQVELHQLTKERDSLLVYSVDFFHPSNIGYKNWQDAFAEALD